MVRMPVTSRARREERKNDAIPVDTRAASTQVGTMSTAPTRASSTGAGPRVQVKTWVNATTVSTIVGTLTNAITASPKVSRSIGMPNSAKRRGSTVSSTPNASGSSRNPSTMPVPSTVSVTFATSAGASRSATSPTIATTAIPSP